MTGRERNGSQEAEAPAEQDEEAEQTVTATAPLIVASTTTVGVVVGWLGWSGWPRVTGLAHAPIGEVGLPLLPIGVGGRPGRRRSDNGHFSNVGAGRRAGTLRARTRTGASPGRSPETRKW